MSVQASVLNLNSPLTAASATWRSRTLAVILMVAIAAIFWVDSRWRFAPTVSHRSLKGCWPRESATSPSSPLCLPRPRSMWLSSR